MALKSASIPTREISQDGLQYILSQIESELYASKVYKAALAGLKEQMGVASESAQLLLAAVSRQAIGLALNHLAPQYKTEPSPAVSESDDYPSFPEWAIAEPAQFSNSTDCSGNFSDTGRTNSGKAPHMGTPSTDQSSWGGSNRKKKLASAELDAQTAAEKWAERVRQLGQEIHSNRQAQSVSPSQLHRHTLVPLRHIEAIESGRVEQLPEDVYVRGFIRRLGDALGLDGAGMAASIPAPYALNSMVPSWQVDEPPSGTQLRPVHLYIGYTALMASAFGGLACMSGQSAPRGVAQPDPAFSSPPPASQSAPSAAPTHTPGLKSNVPGVKTGGYGVAGPDIAPPEALPANG